MRQSKYAAGVIARLEREGHKLAPADILRLNALGLQVESPGHEIGGLDVPPVVWAGPVPFYGLTVQAAYWHEAFASVWWTGSNLEKAIAYQHAQGREPGAFAGQMQRQSVAEATVNAWWRNLPCTADEVWSAVELLQEQTEDQRANAITDDNNAPDVVRRMVSDIVAATGIKADDWACESLAFALATFRSWARAQAAYSGLGNESNTGAAGRANMAMFRAINEIKKRTSTNG